MVRGVVSCCGDWGEVLGGDMFARTCVPFISALMMGLLVLARSSTLSIRDPPRERSEFSFVERQVRKYRMLVRKFPAPPA